MPMKSEKLLLPKGKLTIRYRQQRGVFQTFAGTRYVDGASGDTPEEAAAWLAKQYLVPYGAKATVYGYRQPFTIAISNISC